jgi:uncharacterized OsmC-like protein
MELVLVALGGCTGMDVVSILRKMVTVHLFGKLNRKFHVEVLPS